MFCFTGSQLQVETKKFSTEDRTNKFKPPRQEFFIYLRGGSKANLKIQKNQNMVLGRQYFVIDLNVAQLKFAQTRHVEI